MPNEAYKQAALAYDRGEFARAREIYESIAEAGNAYALVLLASMCIEGQGAPVDLERAQELLDQAIRLGVQEAVLQQAALWQSRGDMHKYFLAIKEGARLGLLPAQYQLGLCYTRGLGVAQSAEKAVAAMEIAAERGHLGAKIFLARRLIARPIDPLGLLRGMLLFVWSTCLHYWLAFTKPDDDRIR